MPLNKKDFDTAKNSIYERLDQWIVRTKGKEGLQVNGIDRLVKNFPDTLMRYRTKDQHDECRLVPITRSYEERLRSIFINSMSCVPPVIGEYAKQFSNGLEQELLPAYASEEQYKPPILERRKTASDNRIGTSKQNVRGKSRQDTSRLRRHNTSRQDRDSKTGLDFLTITSPCSSESETESQSEHEDGVTDVFIPVPTETATVNLLKLPAIESIPQQTKQVSDVSAKLSRGLAPSDKSKQSITLVPLPEENTASVSHFQSKFRKSAKIWHSKSKKSKIGRTRPSLTLKTDVNPVQLEKEKRKSIGRDGKLKVTRQQRRESRLRRMSIMEEKYIKMKSLPFRKFCRMIYHIVALFRVTCRQLKKEEKKNTAFERVGTDGEVLSFDPQDYKSASKTYGGLTKMARKALTKVPRDRTDVDIMVLLEVINRMPFFQKYSMSIKRDLAKCLEYDKVEAERVIIRQDHPGFRMYFVSSGNLGVRMQITDPRTGEKIVRQIKEFTSGCYFGELALMRNIKRTATVYSKTTCELLSMTKDNFNKVLRDAWDYLRAERLYILQHSRYFKLWEPQQLETAADISELKDYPDNFAIAGDTPGLSDFVYFLTKGDCVVVRRIQMIRQKSPHLESTLHLPEDACGPSFFKKNYGKLWRKQTAEFRFVTMFTIHPGDYFSAGEDLTDTFIISKGKVQCLVVSAVQFEIQTRMEDLQLMAEARTPMLVSNQYLYNELMANKAWNKYKHGVVEEIAKNRKIPTTTRFEDVPLSIRVEPRVLPK